MGVGRRDCADTARNTSCAEPCGWSVPDRSPTATSPATVVHMWPGRFLRSAGLLAAIAVVMTACGAEQPPPGSAPTTSSMAVAVPDVPLPDGARLPGGVRLTGPAPHPQTRGDYVEWKATYALGSSPASSVLGILEGSITARGWSVQRGPHDVFATRCGSNRCELLTARLLRATVLVMYASRPA
jgi:hypothetical protein